MKIKNNKIDLFWKYKHAAECWGPAIPHRSAFTAKHWLSSRENAFDSFWKLCWCRFFRMYSHFTLHYIPALKLSISAPDLCHNINFKHIFTCLMFFCLTHHLPGHGARKFDVSISQHNGCFTAASTSSTEKLRIFPHYIWVLRR